MFGTPQALTGLQFRASASFAIQTLDDMIPLVAIQTKSSPARKEEKEHPDLELDSLKSPR